MVRALLVVSLLLVACKRSHSPPPPPKPEELAVPPSDQTTVKPGTLRTNKIDTAYGVAIAPGQDLAKLEQLAKDKGPKLEIARAELKDLFDDEQLGYVAEKLPPAQLATLKTTPGVILLHATGSDGMKVAHDLATITAEVADAAHGWVLDPDTFAVYTAADFHSHVPDEHPNARKLIMVHSVAGGGEQPFMDTSGLHRYGLPELYVPEVANGSVNQITQLMNAAAQVLLDGGDVDEKGQIAIDFKKLGWDVGIIEKGTGKAVWNTRWTKEPDTGERMLELVPPTGTGIVELEKMIDECFGSRPDKVTMLKDDDPELLAAGKHARADLVRLRGHFAKGIPLGERLTVKAKFTGTDNAVEWMWVDVVAFKRDTLEGTLANDPEVLTSMSNGQKVKVRLADVADYFHETKSGESAGGYSIEIFRKRGLLPEGY